MCLEDQLTVRWMSQLQSTAMDLCQLAAMLFIVTPSLKVQGMGMSCRGVGGGGEKLLQSPETLYAHHVIKASSEKSLFCNTCSFPRNQ